MSAFDPTDAVNRWIASSSCRRAVVKQSDTAKQAKKVASRKRKKGSSTAHTAEKDEMAVSDEHQEDRADGEAGPEPGPAQEQVEDADMVPDTGPDDGEGPEQCPKQVWPYSERLI